MHYTKCIQCGRPFESVISQDHAEVGKKEANAVLIKEMVKMQTKVEVENVPNEKNLVFWGYFVLFLPMILDAINGRQSYPEGMISIIHLKIGILVLPIGVFAAHLFFFRDRKKIGAIAGIILSCLFMIIPLMFYKKYWSSVELINELHESMCQVSSQFRSANSEDAMKIPILSYDKKTMVFKQIWDSNDEEGYAEMLNGYEETVRGIRGQISSDREYAKMFMYGISYEIVLKKGSEEERHETISRKDVQEMFLKVKN